MLHGLALPETHFTSVEGGTVDDNTHGVEEFRDHLDTIFALVLRTRCLGSVVDALHQRLFTVTHSTHRFTDTHIYTNTQHRAHSTQLTVG
jgi:hypothetical protein